MDRFTKREIEIIKHALGWPKNYRNYYYQGGDDIAICESLVSKGAMVEKKIDWVCGGRLFIVTENMAKEVAECTLNNK